MNISLVYMTAADKAEARRIGEHLVKSRLAACVNILDHMNSMYFWKGQFQDDQEAVMIAKTVHDKVPALIEAATAMHSYECPCIVTVPISDGHPAFLQWIAESVQ